MQTTNLPKRKPTRLKDFDYSLPRGYFVTICTEGRREILSTIVGEGLAPPEAQLSAYGEIAKEQILSLEAQYSNVKIDSFVIMPNHIHMVLILHENTGGASPSPTISDVVCSFKSRCARASRKLGFEGKLFQRSFYDHVIRNKEDYKQISKYIYENPLNWEKDEFFK